MTREVVKVTPEMAIKWLDCNTHNRPIRQAKVEKFARDMKEGRWLLTHQGVLFADDGTLLDGQHRLWAVVESHTTVEFEVTRGADAKVQEVIDLGERRTERDILTLRGEKVDNLAIAVAKAIAKSFYGDTMSQSHVVQTYTRYREQIMLACQSVKPVKFIRVAPVLTAMARGLISGTVSNAALSRFGQVLADGMMNGIEEKPIILLRNVLTSGKADRPGIIYAKAERALLAYVLNDPIRTLQYSEAELFPLPDDGKRKYSKAAAQQRVQSLAQHVKKRKRKVA